MKYTHVILGGSGHIGSVLSAKLIEQGKQVLIVGHDPGKAVEWTAKGATYSVADILDTKKLRALFSQGERLFILNPPAPPDRDSDAVERQQVRSILQAVEDLPLKKIVAASTYGAQQGEDIYDLGTLYDLEQGLQKLKVPLAVLRSAYYMSNFDQILPTVKARHELTTVFPKDFKLPMVAPADIGHYAAALLQDQRNGLFFIEGPEPYSNQDAADILQQIINEEVQVKTIPEPDWVDFMMKGGFSERSARSFAGMAKLTLEKSAAASDPERGPTSLRNYLTAAYKTIDK
ncbi:MAG: NmrA family NAD(P)-binding protein [Mucilaginibacter sp.]|nr:NmrA family NAD(P)-binding protein [Mucilaginibacter sp.]